VALSHLSANLLTANGTEITFGPNSTLQIRFAILEKRPFGKIFLKMFVAIVVSLLMLFSGLLYTYAINKLTGTPPDSGAIFLLYLAIAIYVISVVLQLANAGGN
jgi:hypothetical protein